VNVPAGVVIPSVSTVDSTVTVTAGGQQQAMTIQARRESTMTVKESAGGQPTVVEVVYGPNNVTTQSAGGQKQEQPFPLSGKTVTVKRGADGRVTHDAGQLPPQVEQELTKAFDWDGGLYPRQPVAVGDEWAPDPAKLMAAMPVGAGAKADIKCKLAKVGEIRGRATYDVVVAGKVTAEQNGGKVELTIGGVVQIDRQTGAPAQQDLIMTVAGGDANQQMTARVQMSGSNEFRGGAAPAPAPAPVVGPGPVPAPAPAPVPAPAPAPQPAVARDAFNGNFKGEKLSAEFTVNGDAIAGFLILGDQRFPATAKIDGSKATGSFEASGKKFEFTAVLKGTDLSVESGGTTYNLSKAQAAPKNPLGQ
ncbi:MAG TPA: hypothetical protein VF796_02270, partial [Humisphaera sp.]